MKRDLILVIILTFWLLGCCIIEKNEIGSEGLTEVNIDPIDGNTLPLNYIDIVAAVPLIETPESIVGKADKVYFEGNKFFILDSQENSIAIFDSTGVFIRKIKQYGKGPNEYSSMIRVKVNPEQNYISIWDINRKKIHYYDLNGNYLREHTFKFWSLDVVELEGKYIVYFGERVESNITNNIYIVDNDNRVVGKHLPRFSKGQVGLRTRVFNEYTNSFNFSSPSSDTIFNISSNGLQAKYFVNFGACSLMENERKLTESNAQEILVKNFAWNISGIIETDSALFFNYMLGSYLYYGFYLKSTGETFTGKSFSKEERLFTSLSFPNGFSQRNGLYLRTVYLSELKTILEEKQSKFNNVNELLKSDLSSNNPIVLMYRIRKPEQ